MENVYKAFMQAMVKGYGSKSWPILNKDSFRDATNTYRSFVQVLVKNHYGPGSRVKSFASMFHRHTAIYHDYDRWRGHDGDVTERGPHSESRFHNVQNNMSKEQPHRSGEPAATQRDFQDTDSQSRRYFIDPITNRKVALEDHASQTTRPYEPNPEAKDTEAVADSVRSDIDVAQPARDSVDPPPNLGSHKQSEHTEGEVASSRNESNEPSSQNRESDQHWLTIDISPIVNGEERRPEPASDDLDGGSSKAHVQFDDLKPPSAQIDENAPISADEFAFILGNATKQDGDSQGEAIRESTTSSNDSLTESRENYGESATSTTGSASVWEDSSPPHVLLDSVQRLQNRTSLKPAGYFERMVAPERLHEYPCIVQQTEPGDFPRSTIEGLRQKYDKTNIKKYTAVRCQEPAERFETTSPEALGPSEGSIGNQRVTINENSHEQSLSGLPSKTYKVDADNPAPETLGKLREGQFDESVSPKHRAWLESMQQLSQAVREHEIVSDAADREAALAIRQAKFRLDKEKNSAKKLTGNFARDFPEEFEKSWTQTLSSIPPETFDTPEQQATPSEGQSMEGGLEGGFGQPEPCKLQPALDRHDKARSAIRTSQDGTHQDQEMPPQNGETVPETREELLWRYKADRAAVDSDVFDLERKSQEQASRAKENSLKAQEAAENPKQRAPRPGEALRDRIGAIGEDLSSTSSNTSNTPYKILAYDPTSQTVSIAETSSLVADFTSALSPAAALSRLSYPTKFFPHFASLEADGFEIVSGSGDVLVFRKARPSTNEREISRPEKPEPSAAADATSDPNSTPINPIDMTGRPKFMTPASANFASPTGYVAYPESETMDLPPPPPRIKYNIDLRREEPVYSGPKTRAYGGKERKKPGVIKRLLVGGVWVAGISYGLGVVSEYFVTGGVDGAGPAGF